MTPKEKKVITQALGALVRAEAIYGQSNSDIQTALREMLEQPEQINKPVSEIELLQPSLTLGNSPLPFVSPFSKITTFKFKRYVNGLRMAEDVVIEREKTLDAAIKKALTLCPNREKTVLVYIPQQSD